NPSYNGKDPCPSHCLDAGPAVGNWSVYHNLEQFQRCTQNLFLDFSLYDLVDDPNTLHRLRACTVWGTDWNTLAPPSQPPVPATVLNVTYQLGWWSSASASVTGTAGDAYSLVKEMGLYLSNGYGPRNNSAVMFGLSGDATIGLYLGSALQNEGAGDFISRTVTSAISRKGVADGVMVQLCGGGRDADHVFGLVAAVNRTFESIQTAVQAWSNAMCLDGFSESLNVTGPVYVTAPPLVPISNDTDINSITGGPGLNPGGNGSDTLSLRHARAAKSLGRRADCTTIQVVAGDSCASLATKCGISGAAFTSYNPQANLCSTLQPYQYVCCTSGTLPNYAPKPNADGSCAVYTTVAGDSCWSIAASHSLTPDDLESFNKLTWGWSGCGNLWVGVNMCLSTGSPPMPAPVANAVCGPQVPGTAKPASGTDLSTLNPCLLNTCCDVWGQCGTTEEFCTNTSTGAPGTAAPGTNGCISNCGTNIVRSAPPAVWQKVGYFEGFNLGRSCVNMDASQIDTSKYTHIHYAFGTLSPSYDVIIGDNAATYEFNAFKALTGVKRILSFGGWDFSTGLNTYYIFRDGVTPANRLTMATNIANFIKVNNLDGVDIDWEYPGAPDIPNIPPASTSDGVNYLAFLVILKNLLPGKTVSIAAPASYWYLKGFPIKAMSAVVDYIIFMTYDLHGQWDYNNKWSDPGCPGGNCLRSDVNLTETISALVMITKAGVPSNKVIVGVTSYGRSFGMTDPNCWSETCTYLGPDSAAEKGLCTGTAGYISDAEINDISNRGGATYHYDLISQTDIMVYDSNQWVGWMSPSTKAVRGVLYQGLNMGGVTDWAIDLETNLDPPVKDEDWPYFIRAVNSGIDPQLGARTGNWTQLNCDDPAAKDDIYFTADARWAELDCADAWQNALDHWTKVDRPAQNVNFLDSLQFSFKTVEGAECGKMTTPDHCTEYLQCQDVHGDPGETGPAAWLIWNSLININSMYLSFYGGLFKALAILDSGLQAFNNDFAPIPQPDNNVALQIILDLVGLGALMIAAPVFNNFLSRLPYFVANAGKLDNPRDISYASISTIISVVKDLTGDNHSVDTWTAVRQATLSAYFGEVIWGWANSTEAAGQWLFGGSDDAITQLSKMVANGHFVPTASSGNNKTPGTISDTDIIASIMKAFFAFAIPTAWSVSGRTPVILDTGAPCSSTNPDDFGFFAGNDASSSYACYNGNMYFIASPVGNEQDCEAGSCDGCVPVCVDAHFTKLPGVEKLTTGNQYGGITLQDIISGAVRTKQQNGKNTGAPGRPTDPTLIDGLYNQDITTPGYIFIPVCSPLEAYTNW
ncbi:glycoside hydrolase, partial [Thozetella sp. PMI_491]